MTSQFVEYLIAQKPFSSAAVEHGRKYEPMALKECEKNLKRIGRPAKILKSGLFVLPKIPILGCSPNTKVIDLSLKDIYGIGEVKYSSSKFHISSLDTCDGPGFLMKNKDGKPFL